MSQSGITRVGTKAKEIEGLTGNVGGLIPADSSYNINLIGGNSITSTGVTATNTITFDVTGTLANQLLIGNATGSIDNFTALDDGMLIIGSTGNIPVGATLTSADASVTITTGAGSIDLAVVSAVPPVPLTFTSDAGDATEASNAISFLGGSNLSSTGSGAIVTYNLSGTTENTVQIGNAGGSLTSLAAATNGQIIIGSTGATPSIASLSAPASGLSITGGAGTITLALTDDLLALESLAVAGLSTRTAASTWVTRSLAAPAAGFTVTNPDGVAGNPTFALSDDLSGIEALATTGIVSRTAANTYAATTITQHSVLIGDAGELPANLGPLGNGELIIGSVGVAPVATSMTNGSNITWTGGAGTLKADLTGTTDHTVQVGNAAESLTSLAAATNGQALLGSTGANPVFSTIGSSDSTITWTLGAGTLTAQARAATDAVTGVIEISTDAEAVAHTLSDKAIVPSNLDNVFAAPPAIGSTTPSTGAFTTLTTTSTVGIGEATPITQFEMTGTAPYLTLHNSTQENRDAGRECILAMRGEKLDGTEFEEFNLTVSQDGAADDQKAELKISLNGGTGSRMLVSANTNSSDCLQINGYGSSYNRLIFNVANNTSSQILFMENGSVEKWSIGNAAGDDSFNIEVGGGNFSTPALKITTAGVLIYQTLSEIKKAEAVADEASITLPTAVTGELMVMVEGQDEYALCHVKDDGTVTLLQTIGDVVKTDTDTNLCIFDNGTGAVIKNRLGAQYTLIYRFQYK